MKEIFRKINGFNDYQISNYGNVKSLKFNKERILKPINNKGYSHIILSINNIRRWKYIHRLVAHAFILNPDNKPETNHKDGNKQNNYVDNLEWCTISENHKHAWKTGLKNSKSIQGVKNVNSKLSENEVLTIHGLALSEMKQKEIAIIYEICHTNVSCIVNGKRWKHLIGV